MNHYITKDGDQIDDICYKHYGHHNGTAEAVYEANINLSAQDFILPAGIKIHLPEIVIKRDDLIELFE